MPKPQFPMTAVVTPSEGDGDRVGSQGYLGVVMGVDVDDAGHQREAAGVDDLVGAPSKVRLGDLADRGNPRITDRDVGAARLPSKPVDNRRTPDQQIVHPGPPPAMSGARRY